MLKIEELVSRLDNVADRESRETAHELMKAILEFHGSGIERMMEIVFESGDSGKAAIRRFAADNLVSSLLVLHGLHPDDLETRVHHALGKFHGSAELVSVFDDVVKVRLTEGGCGLRDAVEAALREAAPDASGFVIEERVTLVSLGAA